MKAIQILFVLGTRPEAIKLAPVVRHLRELPEFRVQVSVTAQHRQMLDQVLSVFSIVPEFDLDIMVMGQSLFQSTSRILAGLEAILLSARPNLIIVQGDTTTTLCGALAGYYAKVPVAHIEAGLRTGDLLRPFPEEMNRVLSGRLASLHFPPTPWAASNLRAEGVPESEIVVTGNTGIDAVLYIRHHIESDAIGGFAHGALDRSRKLVLVTAHRRESFGHGLEGICDALLQLAARPDVQIVFPVHPNPNVRTIVYERISHIASILLIDPLDYISFVDLMSRAYLILTDSGGIQEEAPSLGKPVLVLRDKTERPEGVQAGTVRLVGTDAARIVSEVSRLLDDRSEYESMARITNPYGDGHASQRIADAIRARFGKSSSKHA